MIWAAYNFLGDLIETADSEDELVESLCYLGYDPDDLFIVQVWR